MVWPKVDDLPFTLADQRGVFCAQCLKYIDLTLPWPHPDSLERHHLLPKAKVKAFFGGRHLTKHWFVPVHRYPCHSEFIQGIANAAWGNLSTVLNTGVSAMEKAALQCHENANYGANLIIRAAILRASTEPCDPKTLTYAFSSCAGFRYGHSILSPFLPAVLPPDASVLWYRAQDAVSQGNSDLARTLFQAGDDQLTGRQSKKLVGDRARRRLFVFRDQTDATTAQDAADNNAYQRSTAILGNAMLHSMNGNRTKACAGFNQLNYCDANLLYKSVTSEFQARLLLESEEKPDPEGIYELLITAQYIQVMLGHRVPMHIKPSKLHLDGPEFVPGHLLLKVPAMQMRKKGLTKLRRRVIGNDEQGSIFDLVRHALLMKYVR